MTAGTSLAQSATKPVRGGRSAKPARSSPILPSVWQAWSCCLEGRPFPAFLPACRTDSSHAAPDHQACMLRQFGWARFVGHAAAARCPLKVPACPSLRQTGRLAFLADQAARASERPRDPQQAGVSIGERYAAPPSSRSGVGHRHGHHSSARRRVAGPPWRLAGRRSFDPGCLACNGPSFGMAILVSGTARIRRSAEPSHLQARPPLRQDRGGWFALFAASSDPPGPLVDQAGDARAAGCSVPAWPKLPAGRLARHSIAGFVRPGPGHQGRGAIASTCRTEDAATKHLPLPLIAAMPFPTPHARPRHVHG